MRKLLFTTAAVLLVTGLVWIGVSLASPRASAADTADAEPVPAPAEAPSKAVNPLSVPAPLVPEAEKGLAYLANQQLPNGGWGQGGGWRTVAAGGRIEPTDERYHEESDVANTALDDVLSKIERHQRDDGTFADNQGWASVLSQSIANKALNRARQSGAGVKDSVLMKVRRQASDGYDEASGEFRGGEGYGSTAGVKLYKDASSLAALDDLAKTGEEEAEEARALLESEASAEVKREAAAKLEALERTRKEKDQALETMAAQLSDSGFVAGFGSSGGEEYLSYMNISEALAAKGGEAWESWNGRVAKSLFEAQNGDGSWSGHHCITGRTFVTSAALLTLLADRAPHPRAEG